MKETAGIVQKFCPQCGAIVDADARFCKHCAFALADSAQRSSPADPSSRSQKANSNPTLKVLGIAVSVLLLLAVLGAYLLIKYRAKLARTANPTTLSTPIVSGSPKQPEGQFSRVEVKNAPASAPQPISLEEQAKSHVKKMAESRWFTKCGNSYFSQPVGYDASLEQRKDPFYLISQASPLTDADRLNDIRWKGRVQLQYSAMRFHSSGGWSDWRPYRAFVKYVFTVSLRGTNWQAQGATYLLDRGHQRIKCSDVPG